MTATRMLGACLCGAVRYQADGPLGTMFHCHCSRCRKHHGAAFATFVGARLQGFAWLSGADNVERYRSSEHGFRYFCRSCGAVTPALLEAQEQVLLPAGNLEGELELRPHNHVFVGSKASWYDITDRLPQHAACAGQPDTAAKQPLAPSQKMLGGSCLCGDIAYEITGPVVRMVNCHCSRCRRGRSAAHATNLFCKIADLTFLRGAEQAVEYRVPDAKHFATAFCRRCGAGVPRLSRERGLAIVPAGSLDGDPGVRPTGHIYVGSKASWFDITDGRPQFPTLDPG